MEYYKSILSLAKEAFTISSKLFNKDQSIFLEGNIYSNSLIVGEALGAKEIALKRIFIGDSGLILRTIIKNNGIHKHYHLFINTIPWRPYKNKTPDKDTISKYQHIWENLINLLLIENIICIGKVAEYMINSIKHSIKTKRILYTYHPAFYLRTRKNDVLANINYSIKQFATGICYKHIGYTIIKSY